MSEVTATQPQHDPALQDAPALHYELEPRLRVFWRNLTDLVAAARAAAARNHFAASSRPARNVHPHRAGCCGIILESYGYHVVLVVLIYFFSTSPGSTGQCELPRRLRTPRWSTIALSEYLPPINTGPRGEAKPRKGEPKLAKQEILSVPANPDNNHQTIVTPPQVKLNHDVPLPNIVAWTNIPGQPIAASSRQLSQLKLPQFAPQVVEPTADVSKLKSQTQVHAGATDRGGTDCRRVEDEVQAARCR